MQPSPSAETSGPLRPSRLVGIFVMVVLQLEFGEFPVNHGLQAPGAACINPSAETLKREALER
ncbi:hypothetical protein D9M71_247570 [compost metagenome]